MQSCLTLPWLQSAPANFKQQLAALRGAEEVNLPSLRRLVGHALDASQLGRVSKLIQQHVAAIEATGSLRKVKVAVAASHTASFIVEALVATGLRHGLLVETHLVPYGQAAQQVLDATSALAAWKPDYILLSVDPGALGLAAPVLDENQAKQAVHKAVGHLCALSQAAHENMGAGVILQTLPQALASVFGNFDIRAIGSQRWLISHFNARLAEEGPGTGDLLLDTAALAEMVGLAAWHDDMRWHDAKLPFTLDAIPLYADHVCRLLAAARGLSRKCLVLDLDNTLWGGVIGDDGVDGISIGQGSARGEAHLAIQRYALQLRERGILLAVCSKNELAAALLPFQQHDEMALKEEHFSSFVANWTDKATNLMTIARGLNIGTDALVFLDDNPAERERVRQELPEVAVPEVGDEPADYVRLLAMGGYFEAIAFGQEDRERAAMYEANTRRASAMEVAGNLDDYLRSLDMVCTVKPFDDLGRHRIAQLINKSNQFNLTTRRYSEADVAALARDPSKVCLQIRLVDRCGDNGMISVVIFDKASEQWVCDTWLMSCRVLGRRVEEAVLAHVVQAASAQGVSKLVGRYIPSAKNVIVEKHFEKLGFTMTRADEDGATWWELDCFSYAPPSLDMVIEVAGLDESPAAATATVKAK